MFYNFYLLENAAPNKLIPVEISTEIFCVKPNKVFGVNTGDNRKYRFLI